MTWAGWTWSQAAKCAWNGCDNDADPRWCMHGHDGEILPACDGHHELPCRATRKEYCVCKPKVASKGGEGER